MFKKKIAWIEHPETGEREDVIVEVPKDLMVTSLGLGLLASVGVVALVIRSFFKGAEQEDLKTFEKLQDLGLTH